MDSEIEIRRLRYFDTVMSHGSYSRAAEALGLSQSALTTSIAVLEKSIGTKLFERGRFGAVATKAAFVLQKRAQLIFAELNLARSEIAMLSNGQRSMIRLGVSPTFCKAVIPSLVTKVQQEDEGFLLNIQEAPSASLLESLARGYIDMAVCTPSTTIQIDPEISVEVLFETQDKLITSSSHPLAQCEQVTADQLISYPWAVAEHGGVSHMVFRQLSSECGKLPESIVYTDSVLLLEALLQKGNYITVGSAAHVPFSEGEKMVNLHYQYLQLRRVGLIAIRKRSPLNQAARRMYGLILAACKSQWENPK